MAVLAAVRAMRKMQREQAAIAEEPLARAQWRYFGAHRAEGAPMPPIDDFRCYPLEDVGGDGDNGIPARAAAAVLAMANKGKCPPYVLGAWGDVQAVANKRPVDAPDCLMLQTEDGMLTVVAPEFLPQGIRGGLVAAGEAVSGEVVLRDPDRPLLSWRVTVPERSGAGWIEAQMLLLTAT